MESFIMGYDVEADDIASLIAHAKEIGAHMSEQNAAIVVCDVSGLRPAGERQRPWGMIDCVPSSGTAHQATRVDDIVCEQPAPARWQVSVRVVNKEPS